MLDVRQVLELSMPVARGTKGPLGHLWAQAWTDNDIISSSGLSPVELFLRPGNSPASVCQHFLLSHFLQDHWSDFFKLGRNVPLSV